MARARNIKPGFFDNDTLAECEPLARLLFAGLWTIADRAGRLEDRPRRIKAAVLAYDDCDIDGLLTQLADRGFIVRYKAGGMELIQIVSFAKHQNPHKNEADSVLPAFEQHSTSTVQASEQHGTNRADSLNPITDSLSTDSLINAPAGASDIPATKKSKDDGAEGFNEAWIAYPARPGASKPDALKAWKARVREGVDPQTLIDGVLRYAAYCRACQTDPSYIKQPATFFGPGRHYEADWTPPARASPRNGAPEHRNAAAARAIFGAPSPEYIDV